jgi:hypothetical protein
VYNLPWPGRPRKLGKHQRMVFSSIIKKHRGATGKDLAVFVKQKLRVRISPRTALEERRNLGYRPRTRKRRPKLTVSDLAHRLKWCRKRRNWSWSKAVFLDITTVRSSEARGHVWARRGEELAEEWFEGPAHGPQAFVLGAISRRGTCGLAIFQHRLNAKGYRNLLRQHILPATRQRYRGGFFFVQDNDRKQCARVVREWGEQENVQFLQLPPRSPDLNPIEKVWGPLKDHIASLHPPSYEALSSAIQEYWDGLNFVAVNRYIDHQKPNVLAIIKTLGGHIKE